jgi:S-adenosylmethionine:tRNA ribosyltransferase-isomerase
MVSYRAENRVTHSIFRQLPNFLEPGDLLVINTSGTLNAALPATRRDGMPLVVHLSTRLPSDHWVVELRQTGGWQTQPFLDGQLGETLSLPAGAQITLTMPHRRSLGALQPGRTRLWIASLDLPTPFHAYLQQHGTPIRYSYVRQEWPPEMYQTIYATEPGSAEMPSAGRGFTPQLITQLVARGVQIAPLILHTGVASLEEYEPPYEEYYRVPDTTARQVNAARQSGARVIAVGTTVVRALETVTDSSGVSHAGEGWTDLVITPSRGIRAVNGMLTGLHEPKATHLAMLETLVGRQHLQLIYATALRKRYLWHEFGDLHLLLP